MQLYPVSPMVADFPKISCPCSIREIGRELAEFSVPESRFKAGGSSRIILSEIPSQETITLKLEALDLKSYQKIEDHYHDEARGTFNSFDVPLKFYSSMVPNGKRWIKGIRNQGKWRYSKKPDTPPPQPEGFYITVYLISEEIA